MRRYYVKHIVPSVVINKPPFKTSTGTQPMMFKTTRQQRNGLMNEENIHYKCHSKRNPKCSAEHTKNVGYHSGTKPIGPCLKRVSLHEGWHWLVSLFEYKLFHRDIVFEIVRSEQYLLKGYKRVTVNVNVTCTLWL